ncbi:hypothetical protein ACOEGK_003336 [Pseudomonas aeruginosa]|nr:hypothetical protein [Pseudomonas aeruginosa]HCF7112199.1 hypothetical protein [Pseudomonas aeruginosa]
MTAHTNAAVPHHDPTLLICTDVSKFGADFPATAFERRITDPIWRPTRKQVSPDTVRTWLPMDEPAWVAMNALGAFPKDLRTAAKRLLDGGLAQPEEHSIERIFAGASRQFGPEGIWCTALEIVVAHRRHARLAVDLAATHAGDGVPELLNWANYVSLLGLTSSLRNDPVPDPHVLINHLRRCLSASRLNKLLVDIQVLLDNSESMAKALRSSGLGNYRWLWSDAAGLPDVPVRFAGPNEALEWLCSSISPDGREQSMQESPRRRLRPLREMIRHGQLQLHNDAHGAAVPAAQLIRGMDDLTVGRPIREYKPAQAPSPL